MVTIVGVARSRVTASTTWGPAPRGRPMLQAAVSASTTQPTFNSGESTSRFITTIPTAWSSEELAG